MRKGKGRLKVAEEISAEALVVPNTGEAFKLEASQSTWFYNCFLSIHLEKAQSKEIHKKGTALGPQAG